MNPKPWNPQGFISHGDIHFSPSTRWLEAHWNQHLDTDYLIIQSLVSSYYCGDGVWLPLPLIKTCLLLCSHSGIKTDISTSDVIQVTCLVDVFFPALSLSSLDLRVTPIFLLLYGWVSFCVGFNYMWVQYKKQHLRVPLAFSCSSMYPIN